MDVYLSICGERFCQYRHRGCRNASRLTRPKISLQHRENTTEDIVATFKGNPCITIIFCDSLTNANDEKNDLSFLVRNIPKHDRLIIGGDMNAQISKNENNFSLHSSSNRNGEHLMDFPHENGFTCLNT